MNDDKRYRCESYDGEVTVENYKKTDNTDLAPDVVTRMIQKRFGL